MTLLLENPMPIIFAGIFIEAILGVMLLQTGRGVVLVVMIGVLLVVLGGVGIEALVVTERERVEATLEAGAAAFVDGDLERVLRVVAQDAHGTRAAAGGLLRRAEFDQIKITDLKITMVRTTSPPTARARLIAVVSARDRRGEITVMNQLVNVEIQLRLEGDRWLIIGHEWEHVTEGL
jgi:Na+-transporting methylmalonyl-CoA/oxaloacetate decarboxylase gamma subunit